MDRSSAAKLTLLVMKSKTRQAFSVVPGKSDNAERCRTPTRDPYAAADAAGREWSTIVPRTSPWGYDPGSARALRACPGQQLSKCRHLRPHHGGEVISIFHPAARRARVMQHSCPSEQREGARKAGPRLRPVARLLKRMQAAGTTGTAGQTRPSPRDGVNGVLRALPGDRLSCPHRPRVPSSNAHGLDLSVERPGPHDFAVRNHCARRHSHHVHRSPPPRS